MTDLTSFGNSVSVWNDGSALNQLDGVNRRGDGYPGRAIPSRLATSGKCETHIHPFSSVAGGLAGQIGVYKAQPARAVDTHLNAA